MWWQNAAVVLALGLDNLVASAALGASNVPHKWKAALLFALFEGGMPIAGFLLGRSVSAVIGAWGFYIGIGAVFALGLYMLFAGDDDDKETASRFGGGLKGWGLIAAAAAMSLDELGAGAGFGLLHFPILTTSLIMAVQAFFFSYAGLTFGKRLRPLLGEWAEKTGGIVLMAVAALLLAKTLL